MAKYHIDKKNNYDRLISVPANILLINKMSKDRYYNLNSLKTNL